MRRTVLLRALTAIWSFWFAAAFLEVPVVHACAVHGAAAGAPAAHAHHHGAPTPTHHGPQCTCLSQCSGTSAAALSSPPLVVGASTIQLDAVAHRVPAVVIVARPHARPFANGPPVA